jgi:Tfp pilus assembly protein PilF
MKLNVPSVEEQYTRALHLFQSGNLKGAAFYLKNVLITNPDHANARNDLGALYFHQGELEQALVHLRRACALRPEDSNAQHNLAEVRRSLARKSAANN